MWPGPFFRDGGNLWGRESAMKDERKAEALRIMRERVCSIWPDCSCRATLLLWQDNFRDEAATWTREELEWAEDIIFLSLMCVEHHCPDLSLRMYAAQQLSNPFWNR